MALQITTHAAHIDLEPRHNLRHVGYDLYDVWRENGRFCARQVGSGEAVRFDSESEFEQYFIDLTVAFYEWIEAVFPGALKVEQVEARCDREDNNPARQHPEGF